MNTDIEICRDDYLIGGIVYRKQYSTVVTDKKIGNVYTYLYNNGPLVATRLYKKGIRNGKTYQFNENDLSLCICDATHNNLDGYYIQTQLADGSIRLFRD